MSRVRAAGVAGLLSIGLLACSSPSTGNPSATTPSAAPAATPTAAASSNAKELEALLPNTLGGHVLRKFSWTGSEWVAAQQEGDALTVNWLTNLGSSLDDVSVASAVAANLEIDVFRVNGVDHTTLISTLQTALAQRSPKPDWTTATVGGKTVQFWSRPEHTDEWLYGTADLIFIVGADDQAIASEALAGLP